MNPVILHTIAILIVFRITFAYSPLILDGRSSYQKEKEDSVCLTAGCVHAASRVLKHIDPSVDPCDDFYKFSCGNFIKRTSIPDDKSFVISFNEISDKVDTQIRNVLEEDIRKNDSQPLVLVKELYNVCMNTCIIENEGLEPINALINDLGGWPVLEGKHWKAKHFDWKNIMYKFQQMGFSPFSLLSAYVGINSKNSSYRIFNIDQAMLRLEREYYKEGFENHILKAYYNYLVDVAVEFGAGKEVALKEIKAAVEFEIDIAKITLPNEERRNWTTLTNQMTIRELQAKYPIMCWLDYINSLLSVGGISMSADDMVDVSVPKYLIDLGHLLKRTPKRTQANYLIGQAVADAVPFLTKRLRNSKLKFQKIYSGTMSLKPRWKECVEVVNGGINIAASALYVRTYFHEESKRNAGLLVENLSKTFHDVLAQVDWMDYETKRKAIEKASAMKFHIAYPRELLDDGLIEKYYVGFNKSKNYLEFALNIRKFFNYKSISKLCKRINKTEWINHADATSVNAYYAVSENSIMLPAGILQGAFFDSDRPNYMNYGSMGFVIGHEITHGFDDVGRQFNKDGEMTEWWGTETKKKYLNKTQCIIDQYANFTAPEVNMKLNGITTLGENIADNGGIKEAYLAYNRWVQENGEEPRLPGLGYTTKQLFWISSAILWCTKQRKQHIRQQILGDAHSPAYFRVIGSLSNSPHFAKDFSCPLGSRMNPKHKCSVW